MHRAAWDLPLPTCSGPRQPIRDPFFAFPWRLALARRYSARYINDVVAHLAGVVDSVHDTATRIGIEAESRLDRHRYRGEARIEVERGGKTDSFVSLVDPAARSIEFGHRHNFTGRWVPGLYIVTGAAHRF
ncbi:DUF5403 family protein [Actinokineospora baliensis]|uniref:DUF5403 family protein n=1 Tax=Actinokineospora baliensis TaxID=547056 RepID=UPI003558C68D